jgi:hypothetical protein
MTIERDEQFRLRTAEALGRIEQKAEDTLQHVIALNVTVASQGQRISVLESSWRTIRAVMTGMVAALAAGAALVVAWFGVSGSE